jgi:hypothetical protein
MTKMNIDHQKWTLFQREVAYINEITIMIEMNIIFTQRRLVVGCEMR